MTAADRLPFVLARLAAAEAETAAAQAERVEVLAGLIEEGMDPAGAADAFGLSRSRMYALLTEHRAARPGIARKRGPKPRPKPGPQDADVRPSDRPAES